MTLVPSLAAGRGECIHIFYHTLDLAEGFLLVAEVKCDEVDAVHRRDQHWEVVQLLVGDVVVQQNVG